jgi:hypothetical protein
LFPFAPAVRESPILGRNEIHSKLAGHRLPLASIAVETPWRRIASGRCLRDGVADLQACRTRGETGEAPR